MGKVVVVFDFDKTIIEGDSDRWVVFQLGLKDLFYQLLRTTMPWNTLMNRMMMELHSKGNTIQDISECLKQTPLHPNIISAIKSAHALGCDLRIVSDANVFSIETILKHHGLMDYFSEINTNPTFVDDKGILNISPFHDINFPPHGCHHCPPHMCKGLVIERIKASESQKRFIYLGDGRGDFCPSIKLNEDDYIMPRKSYPLSELIHSHPSLIKANIHEWSSGEELESTLLDLINKVIFEGYKDGESTGLNSADCNNFQSSPIPVPH